MLKPTRWNKLVWEGCPCWPSTVLETLESPAVQDALFLFSMALQLSVKNAAYEGEKSFSFKATSLMKMLNNTSCFHRVSGLLLVLGSLEMGGDMRGESGDPCKVKRYTVGQRLNYLCGIMGIEGERRGASSGSCSQN